MAKGKQIILVASSMFAIAASAFWIYFGYVKKPAYNVALQQRVGTVMAEQTAKLLSGKGRILLITIPTRAQPELQTQLDEFRRALKALGQFSIKEQELDTKDQPKYGPGTGLSGRRFIRAVNNHTADAVVSFVGAPELTDEEISSLKNRPKFIAESRSPDHLPKLFEKGVMQAAVVSRFVFPAPGPLKPSTPQEWFEKRYQVVTAESTNQIPAAE